jgi:PAT family beta-lactamase induction signal transducer AmpG
MPLRRVLAWVSLLYFAEGLPFGVAYKVWPAYFRVHGVSLKAIGLMSLLMLPYTLKPAWAPLVDRFGSRRVWIAGAEICLGGAALALAWLDPRNVTAMLVAVMLAFTVASATQDVAIDAYTVDISTPESTGPINGVRASAYRLALVASGGILMILADHVGWRIPWVLVAVTCVVLAAVVMASPRVRRERRVAASLTASGNLTTVRFAAPAVAALVVIGAWWQGWSPLGITLAAIAGGLAFGAFLDPTLLRWAVRWEMVPVLIFVPLYKVGDTVLGRMVEPFWLDRGLSLTEIGLVSTTLGVALSICGALAGGWFVKRFGIFAGLLWLGIAQSGVNLGYAAVAAFDLPKQAIYVASMLESFGQGLGTAAFLSLLMNLCDREHAATQYALLSALFALSRDVAGAFSGIGVEKLGWAWFFASTSLIAVPALLLLPLIKGRIRERLPSEAQA